MELRLPNIELNAEATILLTSQDAYWLGGLPGQIFPAIEKKKLRQCCFQPVKWLECITLARTA